MTETLVKKTLLPHLLLIAGNGRNVGKTTLACQIIAKLSESTPVIGIKISSHFHSYSENEVVRKGENFVIVEETQNTWKDSSLMLQAGADKVFFVMAEQTHLREAFDNLAELLPSSALVCESGGLHELVQPGLFLFVNLEGRKIVKHKHLLHHPVLVENDGRHFNLNLENIVFQNQKIQFIG